MAHITLSGIIPPVPTPFTRIGELDLDALQRLIGALEPEVDGFVILGSNGEAAFLSEEERRRVLESAREAIPENKIMLAGTGGEATRLVAARNEEAAAAGADAALVLPPHYYKGAMTDGVLAQHYLTLADSSPLPLMLYNIPAATTLSLSPALVGTLAQHERVVGLKDSSGNIMALTEIMRHVPADFTVLTGNAPTFVPALSLGAKGGILAVANVAARAYRGMLESFSRGDLEAARRAQLRYNPLALAVTALYGVPGLKAALRAQGLPAGYPRAPLQDVSREAEESIKSLLAAQEDRYERVG